MAHSAIAPGGSARRASSLRTKHDQRPLTRANEQEITTGKLVVSEFISVDGIIEDPGGSEGNEHGGWSVGSPAPEGMQFKFDALRASAARRQCGPAGKAGTAATLSTAPTSQSAGQG